MKRSKFAVAIVAVGAMLLVASPAQALASVSVVALPNGTTTGFAPTVVAIVEGGTLDVVGADTVIHNLACVDRNRKTKRPLCQSKYAAIGETKPVLGVEKLKPGTYPLLCQLHPQMTVDLTVAGV